MSHPTKPRFIPFPVMVNPVQNCQPGFSLAAWCMPVQATVTPAAKKKKKENKTTKQQKTTKNCCKKQQVPPQPAVQEKKG